MGIKSLLVRHWWDFGSIAAITILFYVLQVPLYFYYTLLAVVAILGVRVVVDLETYLRQSKPQKVGTYKELVESNPYISEDELKIIFTKDLDIYSNFWLLVIGVIVGVLGAPFANIIQSELNIVSTGILSLIVAYTIVFVFTIYLLVRLAWFIVQNRNPFRIRAKLFQEYLEAKEALRARNSFLPGQTDEQE